MAIRKKKAAAEPGNPVNGTDARDEELFRSLAKKKKKRKRRLIRTVVILLVLLAAGVTGAIFFLRRKVTQQFASSGAEVIAYTAQTGSISTTVSGSGTLANIGEETVTLPSGVSVEEVLVSANEPVEKGDVLATVDLASVMSVMADVQTQLSELDEKITEAGNDTVNTSVAAGLSGRIKKLYAEKDEDVLSCMVDHGALALLSADGYMAVDIRATGLEPGDSVQVVRADEKQTVLEGVVDTVTTGVAEILVTDNGPELDEPVTVLAEDGTQLGTGRLTVHSPIRITAVSGTVSSVNVHENSYVYPSSAVFYLTNTSFSANYKLLIRQRAELEEQLLELMQLYQAGALLCPMTGSVSSVEYSDASSASSSAAAAYSGYGTTAQAQAASSDSSAVGIVTISPDVSMEVSISVDESNILSLALGQTAQITVNSIADETFSGEVTEINKTATSASGVTRYSAVITLDKDSRMLPGMSAKVTVRISGVDNAVIIPSEALHQTSSTAYVYTSYDEATQQYGGMVQVIAGISNSSYVEITEGLQPGDTVWYAEEQTDTRDFGAFGGFPGGGDMPDMNFNGSAGGRMQDFGGGAGDRSGGSGRQSGGNMAGGNFSGGRG